MVNTNKNGRHRSDCAARFGLIKSIISSQNIEIVFEQNHKTLSVTVCFCEFLYQNRKKHTDFARFSKCFKKNNTCAE